MITNSNLLIPLSSFDSSNYNELCYVKVWNINGCVDIEFRKIGFAIIAHLLYKVSNISEWYRFKTKNTNQTSGWKKYQ